MELDVDFSHRGRRDLPVRVSEVLDVLPPSSPVTVGILLLFEIDSGDIGVAPS